MKWRERERGEKKLQNKQRPNVNKTWTKPSIMSQTPNVILVTQMKWVFYKWMVNLG